jgi:hypothetical protein
MRTFGIVMAVIMGFIVLTVLGVGCHLFGIGMNHVYKSAEDAVINYDNFQDEWNTCQKLNTDLGIIQSTPDNDKQFAQFSKSQRENAIKQNLNRWVEDYNAKSKEIDKNLWKAKALPYQLSVTDFSNYNNK